MATFKKIQNSYNRDKLIRGMRIHHLIFFSASPDTDRIHYFQTWYKDVLAASLYLICDSSLNLNTVSILLRQDLVNGFIGTYK